MAFYINSFYSEEEVKQESKRIKKERKNKMTVKELIEELKEIDKKYLDHEIIIYNNASADKYYISDVGKENEWEDEEEIYITVS